MKRTIERITRTAMLTVAFMLCTTSAWAATLSSSGYISKDSANPTAVFSGVSLSDIGTKYVLSGKMGGKWVSTKEAAGVYRASSDGTTLTVQFQKVDGASDKYVKCVIVKFTEATVNDVNTIYAYAHATGNSSTLVLGQDFSSATGIPSTGDNVDGYGMFDLSLTAGKKFEFKTTGTGSTYTTSGGQAAKPFWTLKVPTSTSLPENTLVKLTDIRIGSRATTWATDYDSAYMCVTNVNNEGIYSYQVSAYVANRKLMWGSAPVNVLQYQFPDSTPVMVKAGVSRGVVCYYADKTYAANNNNPGGAYLVASGENVPYALNMNPYLTASWRPVQEVEVLVVATATASANANWSTLAWSNGAADWTAAGSTPVRLTVTEDCTITLDSTVSLESVIFDITPGKTLTIAGSNNLTAANGIIVKGGTVAITSSLLRGTVYGNGTLEYDMNNTTTLPSGLTCTNAAWKGTMWIKNGAYTGWLLNYYGSTASTLRLTNINCYIDGNETANPVIDLDGTGLTISNGNSQKIETIKKLTGTGTLTLSGGSANGNGLVIQDASKFYGTIQNTSPAGGSRRYKVTIGASGTYGANRNMVIANGYTASIATGKTWSMPGGFEVSGILAFVGTGSASGPVITANGSTLDFSAATSDTRISGTLTLASGTTIKLPAGATLPYQIATAGDGGLIDNVTVQIGSEEAVTRTVALRNGAITTLAPVNIDTDKTYTVSDVFGTPSATSSYEINVTSDATLNIGSAITVDVVKFNVAANKTLTLTGATLTASQIYVVGEGKVSVSSATALSGTIKGDGRIVFENALPPSGLQASLQNSANWTGTVELKDYEEKSDGNKIINLNLYGNSNSKIALNGVTSTMFAKSGHATYPAVTLKEIEIGESGWTDTNLGPYTADVLYTAKLTGHGTITVKTSGSGTVKFIGDHTFDGSVAFGDDAEKQVAFMRTSDDTIPAVTAGAIVVAGRSNMSIASGKTWTAPGGIKIDGSLTVLTAEATTATSVTPTAYKDGAQIETLEDAIAAGTTTYATGMVVSNQDSMGDVTVIGGQSISGSGGTYMSSLTINDGATLTYDPVITPIRVESAPVFNGTGKLKLAARYAGVTCGKFHLVSYPSSASVSGTLADLVDSTSFNNASYTVTEETVGDYKQLVLRVGNYETDAKEMTIAQFGDSITEGIIRDGYRGTPNYRIPLMQLLEAYGYRPEARGYRSVGSTDANGIPADDNYKWHTGISAQRIHTGLTGSYLRAGFMESIEAHLEQVGVTDIITLKIGTNDSIGNETADNMFEGWTNLVWKIVRMRPTSKIVVCAPVKIRTGENNAPGLRTKIAEYMALTPEQGGFPAGQVTMINGINIVTDDANYYLTDNVHPNWNGHLQLANAWLPAVTNAFESMTARATTGYTAQTVASAADAAELAAYRAGYVKLATFTNFNTKLNTWGETPYSYVNNDYKDTPMGRVAYFVARKTTASPDTRYVWVDMDADSTTGTTLADFGVPTSASVNGVVNNLHIYSNSSAIENVAPTVSGVKGTLMRTEKGVDKADGISTDLAPTGPYGFDWNDTINGSGAWGVLNMARIFDGATPTNHRKLLAAQMLFDFNGFNGGRQNALGIGDFAVHGPYNYANDSVDHFNLNWTFTTDKDEIPTMDARALETSVIEIWGKQVYTATMGESFNFSELTFSPSLPDDLTYCDLVVNVTDNATLTFDSAMSVGSITFNIAENKTLTLAGTLNLSGAVVISGPGKLQLLSSGTFGRMDVASSATLGFADGVSLTITGGLWVASGSTLTLEPNVISTSSSTILSAAAISGTVSVTLPSESGVDYSTIATETSYKIVRTPNVAFSYDGTIGATPTGWGVAVGDGGNWKWEGLSKQLRVGPNSTMPIVYETCNGNHSSSPCKKSSSFSIALYADVSKVTSSGKAVLVCLGSKTTSMVVMYRQGDYVMVGNWINGNTFSPAANPWAAAVPIAPGYHLYTATFNFDTGEIALYRDDGTASGCTSAGTPQASITLPTGDASSGLQLGCAWDNSDSDFVKGDNMALGTIRGYDAVLAADNVEALAQQFPATDNSYTHTVDLNATGKTLTVYDATFTGECYLGVSNGALVIPAGNTVSVPHVRVQNESTGSVTVDVYGTLNVTSVSDDPNLAWKDGGNADYLSYKGILLGMNGSGTGVFTIHEGGVVDGSGTWLQTIAGATGAQTLTVDGGTLKIKGFYSNKQSKSTINLQGNGVIEISQTTDRGQSITYNLGYGTLKAKASLTLSSGNKMSLTFAGANATPTTLDPYGYTMTLSSMSGNGYITVADSSDGHNGTVVLQGSTCNVILTDANAANIDITGYTGAVLYQGTESETLELLDGFAGTVYFTGDVDATGVDLSGATVHIADKCKFTAVAGKEGSLVLGSGAAVTLNVTEEVANYEGYFPTVSGSGTISYYQTDGTAGELTGADHVNGNNLMPYYNVWMPSANGENNTIGADAAARWRLGRLPDANKNVAFKLSGDATVTIDATIAFKDVQVYGTGTLTIQQSGNNVLTVDNGLYTTANAGVEINSGLEFADYTKLEVESALPKKVAVNYGTAESPYGIPTVTGSGALQVTAGHALAALSLTVGNLDVDGALTLLHGASSATTASVYAGGVIDVSSGTSLTVPTFTVDGTANIGSSATLTATSLVVNKTVNVASTGEISATAVSGGGTVNWTGKQPDGDVWKNSEDWTGTNVVMCAGTGRIINIRPEKWGREGSYIVMKNLKGYIDSNGTGEIVNAKVIFEDGENGYALAIDDGYDGYKSYFREIAGSGTIKDAAPRTTEGGRQVFVFKTADEFKGSIVTTAEAGKYYMKRFVFSESETAFSNEYNKIWVLADGNAVIGDDKCWQAQYEIKVAGTVTLEGSATMSSGVIISGSSARINLAGSALTINSTLTATDATWTIGGTLPGTPTRSTPVTLITGLTAEPTLGIVTIAGLSDQYTVYAVEDSGTYNVVVRLKNDEWNSDSATQWTTTSFNGSSDYSDGMNVYFGAIDAVAAKTVTISGTVSPANVTFRAGASTTYTLTGGAFSPSGTVAVESGTVVIESEMTAGAITVADGATLSLTNATVSSISGAGTLNIPAGGVVKTTAANVVSVGALSGSGMLVIEGASPANDTTLQSLLKNSAGWTGTFCVRNLSTAWTDINPNMFGREGSKVQLQGVTGYFTNPKNQNPNLFVPEVIFENGSGDYSGYAFKPSNGYSYSSSYSDNWKNFNVFSKISGSGTLYQASDKGYCQMYWIKDGSGFTGSIDQNHANNNTIIVFAGDAATLTGQDSTYAASQIHVLANATATVGAGATWKPGNAIKISGTVELKGSATMANAVTLSNGAELIFDSANGTVAPLTFGTTATWPADGSVTFDISALVSETVKVPLIKRTGGEIANFAASRVTVVPPTGSPYGASRWTTYTEEDGNNTIYGVVVKPGTIFSVW